MSWFGKTFGFEEFHGTTVMKGANAARIRDQFEYSAIEGTLRSKINDRSFNCGDFSIPSLSELCGILASLEAEQEGEKGGGEEATFENILGNVRALILDPTNAGAIFQAASQFNCLEMINPGVSPEDGVTNYVMDRTQGPICAMACPSATLIRNYFATFPSEGLKGPGQSSMEQIDTSRDVHSILCAELPKGKGLRQNVWRQSNGYMLAADETSISDICKIIEASGEKGEDSALKEACRQALRVGVHWDTETQAGHSIAQVFCSACPVAYDRTTSVVACKDPLTNKVPSKREIWAPLARLILESAYESTFLTAGILALKAKSRKMLYLTKVGGGVFGNSDAWIAAAIQRCLTKYRHLPIDVKVVHYGDPGTGPTNRYASVGI